MGVLPEALVNYLALLGWAPSGGTREIFSLEELIEEFSLERVTPSPAIFDMEKLYWLNRHYLKQAPPERVQRLALPYYTRAMIEELKGSHDIESPSYDWHPNEQTVKWLAKVTQLLVPYVDRLEQLPERAGMILHYDAQAALQSPDNRELLQWPETTAVFARFMFKILEHESASAGSLTPEEFKEIVNHVKAETGAKGKNLFHPIRMMITGSHSGPDFDRLIPIIEEGSRLQLPQKVLSVCERVHAFGKVYKAAA